MTSERTYLDHNASMPLRNEARAAMADALDAIGNPSSVHAEGRRVRSVVEAARERVAHLVNAKPSEVIFTSGATEANNWVMAAGWKTIALARIEHDSVIGPAEASSAELIEVPVSQDGVAQIDALAAEGALGTGTLLTLMMANNETGVIQPVAQAVARVRESGGVVHTDAVQAPGRIPVDFAALGVDAMSLSAHKIGGPRGVGALIVRDGLTLRALITGGGQERRRRGGTENVSGIAGFGAAAEAVANDHAAGERMAALRTKLEAGILRATPNAVVVGQDVERIGNTSCVAVPGKSAETLVIKLDLEGVAISAGSACSSGKVGSSHVLKAMTLAPELARAAIRVSLGPQTQDKDIAAFLAAWEKVAGDAVMAA